MSYYDDAQAIAASTVDVVTDWLGAECMHIGAIDLPAVWFPLDFDATELSTPVLTAYLLSVEDALVHRKVCRELRERFLKASESFVQDIADRLETEDRDDDRTDDLFREAV